VSDSDDVRALKRELMRLGLDFFAMPGGGLVGESGALAKLLRHIRTLEPPTTWHAVFPDLPKHWEAGRPETWIIRYRPFGPYDHQTLPTGPAVHVAWPKTSDPSALERLIRDARVAGLPVHGAGWIGITNPSWSTRDAMIVLQRGTTEDGLHSFLGWLETQADVVLAAIPRLGTETYF
jgi:hypothetical protein